MKSIPDDTTKVVRSGVAKASKDLTEGLKTLGFARTKKMLWTRGHPFTVDFIHLHRDSSTYGKPINYSVSFRLNCGIRVLNDEFEALALNGICSDADRERTGRYHLR